MRYVILGLLLGGPHSLYDLHKHFSAGISLFYSASLGSLQRALQTLVDDGLVTATQAAENRRGRKLHTITDAGRDAWRAWMLEPPTGADLETTVLAKVFFLGMLRTADDRAAVRERLRDRIAHDLGELREVAIRLDAQQQPPEQADAFRYKRATLDYGIRSHELGLSWIDELP